MLLCRGTNEKKLGRCFLQPDAFGDSPGPSSYLDATTSASQTAFHMLEPSDWQTQYEAAGDRLLLKEARLHRQDEVLAYALYHQHQTKPGMHVGPRVASGRCR